MNVWNEIKWKKGESIWMIWNAIIILIYDICSTYYLYILSIHSLLNVQKKAKGDIFKNVNVILTYQAYFLENVKLFEDYSEEILRKCTIYWRNLEECYAIAEYYADDLVKINC